MEDIAAATLEEVRTFFRTYYTPNNAVLTLAGDFDPEEALRKVETWFGDIPAGPPVPPVVAPLQPLGEQRDVLGRAVRLPRLYMAFRAPAYGQRLWYAADLLFCPLRCSRAGSTRTCLRPADRPGGRGLRQPVRRVATS